MCPNLAIFPHLLKYTRQLPAMRREQLYILKSFIIVYNYRWVKLMDIQCSFGIHGL
jgi:hypothetical protein